MRQTFSNVRTQHIHSLRVGKLPNRQFAILSGSELGHIIRIHMQIAAVRFNHIHAVQHVNIKNRVARLDERFLGEARILLVQLPGLHVLGFVLIPVLATLTISRPWVKDSLKFVGASLRPNPQLVKKVSRTISGRQPVDTSTNIRNRLNTSPRFLRVR